MGAFRRDSEHTSSALLPSYKMTLISGFRRPTLAEYMRLTVFRTRGRSTTPDSPRRMHISLLRSISPKGILRKSSTITVSAYFICRDLTIWESWGSVMYVIEYAPGYGEVLRAGEEGTCVSELSAVRKRHQVRRGCLRGRSNAVQRGLEPGLLIWAGFVHGWWEQEERC